MSIAKINKKNISLISLRAHEKQYSTKFGEVKAFKMKKGKKLNH